MTDFDPRRQRIPKHRSRTRPVESLPDRWHPEKPAYQFDLGYKVKMRTPGYSTTLRHGDNE